MSNPLPFDPRVQRAFRYAYRMARFHDHACVTPLHLLLGVARTQYDYRESVWKEAGLVLVGGEPSLQAWMERHRMLRQHLLRMLPNMSTEAVEGAPIALSDTSRQALRTAYQLAHRQSPATLRLQHLVLGLLDRDNQDVYVQQVTAEDLSPLFETYGYAG